MQLWIYITVFHRKLNARERRELLNQVENGAYINLVLKKTEELLIRPRTPIWIYMDVPFGFHAVFGGNDGEEDHFYILRCVHGAFELETQRCHGFRENGTLIIK